MDFRSEPARIVQRDILVNWTKMSLGDVSIIKGVIENEGSSALTTPGSPHWLFWTLLVKLECAVEVLPLQEITAFPMPVAVFRLTEIGQEWVPGFIDFRKLFELTAYNEAPKGNKPPIPEHFRHLKPVRNN